MKGVASAACPSQRMYATQSSNVKVMSDATLLMASRGISI